MAAIPGSVKVSGFVAPSDTSDVYPSHTEEWGRGGYRSVDDLTDRDAITPQRRSENMLVYVRSVKTTFMLDGGIENTDWIIQSGSSLNIETLDEVLEAEPTDFIVVYRAGEPSKIALSTLCELCGSPLPEGLVVNDSGLAVVDNAERYVIKGDTL